MNFYITTPIYYVNDTPHIGHAYTTIVADVLARYHRLFDEDVFFLTGTDEHGQKVQNAAKARGLEPQAHCDEMVKQFQTAWSNLLITPNFFIRTTMEFHKGVVQECLQRLFERGEIYAQPYEGWYCESEEIFYTEKDLVNGLSPTGKPVQKISEQNYFFRMSKYQEALVKHIESHPEFIRPDGKRSEVLGFLRQPLEDLCISRPKSRLTWGIEIPFDRDYVTYVWFDALLNYASGIGLFQGPEKQAVFDKLWPHAIHLIGKDILITHAVYWPTMLMALGLELPKCIFAHGWWLNEHQGKMSKSSGPVVKPLDMAAVVGIEPFRYFLCRDISLGNDAVFSREGVMNRVNAELANNLGNLLSRTLSIAQKYFDGKVPQGAETLPETPALVQLASAVAAKVKGCVSDLSPHTAIGHVVEVLSSTNKYIDTVAPWKRAKENLPQAGECLYTCFETLRICGILLSPIMPTKMAMLLAQLGWHQSPRYGDARQWGLLTPGTPLTGGEALFPRVE